MSEILEYSWVIRDRSGFTKELHRWYIPDWVISFEDEKQWRYLYGEEIKRNTDWVGDKVDAIIQNIISSRKNQSESAQIIDISERYRA
jgi:hypothetical protein